MKVRVTGGNLYRIFLSAERAAGKLEWKPEISPREDLRRTVEHLKALRR
jgi:nucleoside-diphosphate-sugar epimerase